MTEDETPRDYPLPTVLDWAIVVGYANRESKPSQFQVPLAMAILEVREQMQDLRLENEALSQRVTALEAQPVVRSLDLHEIWDNFKILEERVFELEEAKPLTPSATRSVPSSPETPAIGQCVSPGVSHDWRRASLASRNMRGEFFALWVCSKCSMEVLIPQRTSAKPTSSTPSGSGENAATPGRTAPDYGERQWRAQEGGEG